MGFGVLGFRVWSFRNTMVCVYFLYFYVHVYIYIYIYIYVYVFNLVQVYSSTMLLVELDEAKKREAT